MNASGARLWVVVGVVLCLVLAGCQALGAGGGKLVKEVELVCPIEDMHFGVEGFEMQFWQNMENGNISRASFGWSYLNCNEPTMKGWLYGLGDAYVHDDGITDTKNYTEIITDEGGVTCHAAILAREMNKPCVIGTKNATELLADGMRVKVDANLGKVEILN